MAAMSLGRKCALTQGATEGQAEASSRSTETADEGRRQPLTSVLGSK